jgi:hypothetical protein
MIRVDDTQVRYAEGARAEPLEQFTRTLSEDLSRALGGARTSARGIGRAGDAAVAGIVLALESTRPSCAHVNAAGRRAGKVAPGRV